MIDDFKVPLYEKVLVALMSGIFSLAIAVSIQHIKVHKMPRYIIIGAAVLQLILSFGVFVSVMLFFKSALVPDSMPNDEWTALTIAFLFSSFPHIITTTLIFIYDKELTNWVKSRYGEDVEIPTMKSRMTDAGEIMDDNVIANSINDYEKERPIETKTDDKVITPPVTEDKEATPKSGGR